MALNRLMAIADQAQPKQMRSPPAALGSRGEKMIVADDRDGTRMIVDVNERREAPIALYGLYNADRAYTIFYDETNNHRRVHVREDGLNIPEPTCFVIGGIAYSGPQRDFDLKHLRKILQVQDTALEIKLKNVATGDFLKMLTSRKLETFLRWLLEQGLYIHFSVVDPLYWSVVDIVDSILSNDAAAQLIPFERDLKNDLFSILRSDINGLIDLFRRYAFPNVGKERRREFIEELLDLAEARSDLLDHFNYMTLKGVLQLGRNIESLPFIENETSNVLIDSFGAFFLERLYILKNASHILDVEELIMEYLKDVQFVVGDRELNHFRFVNSQSEPGIQISDVVAGFLGKYFSFICGTNDDELIQMRQSLGQQQTANLSLLYELLERSNEENPVFAHAIMSIRDRMMAEGFRKPI
ncbi:hypothetical protein GOC57_30910 [Sinorhizobium meliloti]|uniref:DUF3800 domain-containing protein n=1 Tax=Rhizobium meliloti TaxID=382 RepID=UPI001296F71C|nr:DUF3800 domain-containing protein [Sinorhizobium meliloti]MDW9378027.1 hypothetical protein [Sinorhizobium meliloti]MDW9496628.1 hypothetical protein [Sinorhizobium meliloti]MDW9565180.1 hypothetical protein [Sinorhizobium meliloti]MDW9652606.1 hypothetical protein [Sinorhizobium meliloti]MDW9862812.1 hypothetical protein [Sinorhizobium meliloti]